MDGVISDTQKLHAKIESEILSRYGINMTPQEWKAFFYLSEYPAPANQKRYLRDGIPMTFFEFEEKYGNFADSMWESASIHEPYYDSEDDLY